MPETTVILKTSLCGRKYEILECYVIYVVMSSSKNVPINSYVDDELRRNLVVDRIIRRLCVLLIHLVSTVD